MGYVSDTDRSAEISRDLFQQDFEILELSPDAGLDEVETAYQTLSAAYSPDAVSMASPVKDEMEKQRRKEKVAEIEAAYRNLMRLFGETPSEPVPETPPMDGDGVTDDAETSATARIVRKAPEIPAAERAADGGAAIREIRESLGISLETISTETKIRIKALQNIEAERFAELPPEVYVRGFIKSIAVALAIDPVATVRNYMERYHLATGDSKQKRYQQPSRFSFRWGR